MDGRTSDDRWNAFVQETNMAGGEAGPLSGRALAVKDNIQVEGLAYTAGHPLFESRRGQETAPAVRRLLDAGARLVGMTRTDAGGFGVTTPEVANPVFPGLTVGGSSGGGAAAVAAGLADMALGTDTGGSVRIPAACCGLFGFKPAYGRVPLDGTWPLAPSLDHVGIIARALGDIETAFASLTGRTAERPVAMGGAARRSAVIGIDLSDEASWDPGVRAEFAAAIARLRSAGVRLREVELLAAEATVRAHASIVLSEATPVYAALSEAETTRLGAAARHALARVGRLTQDRIRSARRFRDDGVRRIGECLYAVDAVLTPTLPVPPVPQGAHRVRLAGEDVPAVAAMVRLTCAANLAGVPALAVPVRREGRLPFSVQLVSRADLEWELLSLARDLLPILEPSGDH